MVEIKTLTLQVGTNLIFDKFNFKAAKGEKIGVIGAEGAGKTTLLDIIAGRIMPDSGEVKVSGKIVTISRNVYAHFSELHMAAMSAAEKFKLMLTKSLEDAEGGDKILLLDEPTKNLDGDDVEWLINLLRSDDSLTVIAASNDRYFLKHACSKTVTLGDSAVDKVNLPELQDDDVDEDVLSADNLLKMVDGEEVFQNVSFTISRGQKVALVGKNEVGKTKLLKVFGAGIEVRGSYNFAPSVKKAYMPRVFSSDAAKAELDKLTNSEANFLILDNPTACLSLPMIEALEKALVSYKGTIIFADSDHEFIQAIASRIIDLTPDGTVDRISDYDEFLANETVRQQIESKYKIA